MKIAKIWCVHLKIYENLNFSVGYFPLHQNEERRMPHKLSPLLHLLTSRATALYFTSDSSQRKREDALPDCSKSFGGVEAAKSRCC